MRGLFRYEQKDTFVHNLDPRVKLIYLIGISILTIVFGVPWLLILLFLSTLPFWYFLHPSKSKVKSMFWLFAILSLSFIISQSLFYYWADEPLFCIIPPEFPIIGPLTNGIYVYIDGAIYGLIQSFRFMTTISAAMIFVSTTHPSQLITALGRFFSIKIKNKQYVVGLPYEIAFMVSSAVSFAPVMIEECYGIINAMRARGLDLKGGIRTKLRAAKHLFLPLIVNILRSGRQIAIAADARGFRATKNRSYVKELKLNSNDYVFLTIVIIFTGFGIYLSLVGYGSTPPI